MDFKTSPIKSELLNGSFSSWPKIEFHLDQGFPFQLLSTNFSKDKFLLNPKISQLFYETHGNIAFISLIGSKTSGKSFILNKILGLNDAEGFKVGFSPGIWLWTAPIYIEKENIYVYFLEFEGFSEHESSSILEEKLMMLAMSLSSTVLILNTENEEDDFQRLISLLSFYHENVNISDDKGNIKDFQTPHFFRILKERQSVKVKPKSNLEKLGVLADGKSNILIKALKNDAILLSYDDRNPDSINLIREKILRKSQKKEIEGCVLTKTIFLALIDLMIDALNANKVMEIGNLIKACVEKEIIFSYEEAIISYKSLKVDENLSENDVSDLLRESFEKAIMIYISHAFRFNERYREIYEKFMTKLKDFSKENEKKIRIQYQESVLANANLEFKTQSYTMMNEINSGVYSLADFPHFVKSFERTLQEFDQKIEYTDIKFKTLMEFLPGLLSKALETFKKQGPIRKDYAPIFLSEQKLLNKSRLFQSNILKNSDINVSPLQKLNEELIAENERLRTALMEKDRILKLKDDIIKNNEVEALKTSSKSKKSRGYGC